MFLGEYRLPVEGKGRLRLPSIIRYHLHALYAPEDTALFVTTFDTGCLVCFPRAAWLRAQETLHRAGAPHTRLWRFHTIAAVCPLDERGRLRIPLLFRQQTGIQKDVLLIGFVCWLELWSPHQWERFAAAEGWRF
jgi:MraZ protein